jgi:hypothetical protein
MGCVGLADRARCVSGAGTRDADSSTTDTTYDVRTDAYDVRTDSYNVRTRCPDTRHSPARCAAGQCNPRRDAECGQRRFSEWRPQDRRWTV